MFHGSNPPGFEGKWFPSLQLVSEKKIMKIIDCDFGSYKIYVWSPFSKGPGDTSFTTLWPMAGYGSAGISLPPSLPTTTTQGLMV